MLLQVGTLGTSIDLLGFRCYMRAGRLYLYPNRFLGGREFQTFSMVEAGDHIVARGGLCRARRGRLFTPASPVRRKSTVASVLPRRSRMVWLWCSCPLPYRPCGPERQFRAAGEKSEEVTGAMDAGSATLLRIVVLSQRGIPALLHEGRRIERARVDSAALPPCLRSGWPRRRRATCSGAEAGEPLCSWDGRSGRTPGLRDASRTDQAHPQIDEALQSSVATVYRGPSPGE